MKKLLTLAFGLLLLLAQGALGQPREHEGNHDGGGRASNGGFSGEHPSAGFNNGARFSHQPGNHPVSGFNHNFARGYSNRSFNRSSSLNRAKPNAYNPAHFSYVRSSSVAVPGRFKSLGVRSVPQPLTNRAQYVSTNRVHSTIPLPGVGPRGEALSARLVVRADIGSSVIQHHMGLISSGVEINRINQYNRTEIRPNHYYWHTYNGFNYCHYYDSWGYHWYGWYLGNSCFWTRYYWGNWWWYDSAWSRWCYWHDGGWWWNDPYNTQVVYVYADGNYQPIQTDTAAANPPAPPAVNSSASAGTSVSSAPIVQKGSFKSPDGTRLVKIFGDTNDAILSDTATPPKFAAVFLGSGAKSVRYGQDSGGGLQITVTYTDGSEKNFDENGNSLDGEEPAQSGNNT